MKTQVVFLLIILLTSCARIDTSRIAPGYVEAFSSIKQLLLGFENNISPEVINNIPYASMLVKIGNGPTALMILESISGEEYTWVSADGVFLVTKDGRITQTFGLPNNLREIFSMFTDWNETLNQEKKITSYYSFSNPKLDNLKVISAFSIKQDQIVELMFGPKDLDLITEVIESDEVGWSKVNKYWIDRDDYVWKSIQYVSPRLPEFYLEVTKKPR